MSTIEVTASEHTRALLQRPGRLKDVRFVSRPSEERTTPRMIVARFSDSKEELINLRNALVHDTTTGIPLVFMGLAQRPLSASVLQLLVLVTSRFGGDESDPYVASSVETVRRILKAHAMGAEKQLVASVEIGEGMLSVWSCEPKLYRCAASEIPALATLGKSALGRFEISASGSRIHWPESDIDLDMDAIREFADPKVRLAVESKYRMEAARYGSAIRMVREQRGLRQGGIAGLSERQVRRLENGEGRPHSDTLKKLAAAHGASLSDYMAMLASAPKRYGRRPAPRTRRDVG